MSDEADPSPRDVLYVEAKHLGTEGAIILLGEFDMTGVDLFWGAVSEVLGTCPRSVAVEARGLTFVDSSGLMALVRARDAAAEVGAGFCQGTVVDTDWFDACVAAVLQRQPTSIAADAAV